MDKVAQLLQEKSRFFSGILMVVAGYYLLVVINFSLFLSFVSVDLFVFFFSLFVCFGVCVFFLFVLFCFLVNFQWNYPMRAKTNYGHSLVWVLRKYFRKRKMFIKFIKFTMCMPTMKSRDSDPFFMSDLLCASGKKTLETKLSNDLRA